VGVVNVLKYGYDVIDLEAQVAATAAGLPLTLSAAYARNLAAGVEYDTAWALGIAVGKAAEPRTWEASALYQELDKDALFGQTVDSDFGGGRTDSEGWAFKGGYAPARNITLNATYFLNTVNKDVGTALDADRLQLDVNYKF
jgi:hypothetical protein